MKKTITFLLALFVNHFVFSQWSTDPAVNNAISTTANQQSVPRIVSDGNGGAIITWWDLNLTTSDYNIYSQRINSAGIVQWTTSGIAVCTNPLHQHNPEITSDGFGGAIITWMDSRNGNTDNNIYAQKIDSNGVVPWAVDGIPVCQSINDQTFPKITGDGTGGAIITWQDLRNGTSRLPYAQKINANGIIQWTTNGVPLSNSASESSQIISHGSGGAIVTWHKYTGSNFDIYVQKINTNGIISWGSDGMVICSLASNQQNPQLISDGNSGTIIVWEDYRNVSYSNLYAQKVNAGGLIQWELNGVVIASNALDQRHPKLLSDGSGSAFITWDYNGNDVYAQRINSGGIIQWASDGIRISSGLGAAIPQIITDGTTGAIITWQANSNIFAQRINLGGAVLWINNGASVCINTSLQSFPRLIENGNGGAIITWQDERNSTTNSTDIYASNINADGTLGGSAVLPVTIINFQANKINNKIQLKWQTAFEQNSKYFIIERSSNGIQFSSLANVVASGNSQALKNYSYTDNNPLKGINFYHLKEVDLDGKIKFSKNVSIEMQDNNEVHIYPNPAINNAILLLDKPAKKVVINVFTSNGQLIKRIFIPDGITKVTIDIASFAKGNYIIRIVNNETEEMLKMLKQ